MEAFRARSMRWVRCKVGVEVVRLTVAMEPLRCNGFATLTRMFLHRITTTGCNDRGAWPWRCLTALI